MRNLTAGVMAVMVVVIAMLAATPAMGAARRNIPQDWDLEGWLTTKGSVLSNALTDTAGAPITVMPVKTGTDSVHVYGYTTAKNESLHVYGFVKPLDGDGNAMVPARANVVKGYLAVTDNTEQSILAAGGSGKYLDLTMLCVQNDSAAALACVIKDSTAATTVMAFTVPATSSKEFTFGNYPLIQTVANKPWTITANHSIKVTVQAVKR